MLKRKEIRSEKRSEAKRDLKRKEIWNEERSGMKRDLE